MKPNRNRWQNNPGNTEPYGSGRARTRGHELYEPGESVSERRDDKNGKPDPEPRERSR